MDFFWPSFPKKPTCVDHLCQSYHKFKIQVILDLTQPKSDPSTSILPTPFIPLSHNIFELVIVP